MTPLYEARFSVRRGLLVSVLLWVAFTGTAALSLGPLTLLAARAALGVAEGPLFSLKAMYVRERFSGREVGKPNAVSSFGVNIGLALGYPLVAFLVASSGWRASLWALAGLNLLIGVPLILLFIQAPGRPSPQGTQRGRHLSSLVREALGMPHLAAVLLIEIATLSYLWGASTWLRAYLRDAHHFSLSEMSVFAGLPFAMSLVSQFFGGVLLDRLPPGAAPAVFVAGGIGTAAAVTLSILVPQPYVSASAFVLAGAFWGVQTPAIPTLVQHLAKPGTVGSTYGLVNGVGNLVSAFMPLLMGAAMVSRSSENLQAGFWLLVGSQALAATAGAALLWRLRGDMVGFPAPERA